MRVAINGLLLGGPASGVHRCIRGLVRALDQLDGPDEFLFFTGMGCRRDPCPFQRVRQHRAWVTHGFRPWRILYDQALFPAVARLRGAHLLHGPGYVVPAFSCLPAVVTVYDLIALKNPELCKDSNALHYRWALPRSIRSARRVIVPSEAVKQDLIGLMKTPAEKVEVIPPGLDETFRPLNDMEKQGVRTRYGLPEKFILFVGNIEPKKNLETLIKVFYALKLDRKLDHQLVVAGQKGWKCQKVFDLVKELEFETHVRFLGYVPEEDLAGLYNLADCLAFPSLTEGFGLPPLEAMACGTPVVTSETPAVLEATGDAALHAPATDAKTWRERLEQAMLDRSLRRRMRQLGLQQATRYTWKQAAERTVEVYHRALESSGDRGVRVLDEQGTGGPGGQGQED
ncbi:MAG: glycosyltransferase family 4 protein [Planctomycetes bacterium]|nr:glycosyltransferase family 4 protein [Planctomycetota bacterium]